MKKQTRAWLSKHIADPFVKQAQKDKYISRAAYKLLEINKKYHILVDGYTLLDLGSAPGSWLQVMQLHCPTSIIVAVDILPIKINGKMLYHIHGNFKTQETQKMIQYYSNKFDTICSDMAPNTIGDRLTDHLSSIQLCHDVIDFSLQNLNANGNMVIKFFQGTESKLLIKRIQNHFNYIKTLKPKSSYSSSPEQYIIAKEFHSN